MGKYPACPLVILLFSSAWHSDLRGPLSLVLVGARAPGVGEGCAECLCSLVKGSGEPCRGARSAFVSPARPFFCSSRHSEVGVHPSWAVPREEFWNHHLSVGGAHGCPHALCCFQPGAGKHALCKKSQTQAPLPPRLFAQQDREGLEDAHVLEVLVVGISRQAWH